jgi:hypothetical protein
MIAHRLNSDAVAYSNLAVDFAGDLAPVVIAPGVPALCQHNSD